MLLHAKHLKTGRVRVCYTVLAVNSPRRKTTDHEKMTTEEICTVLVACPPKAMNCNCHHGPAKNQENNLCIRYANKHRVLPRIYIYEALKNYSININKQVKFSVLSLGKLHSCRAREDLQNASTKYISY